MTTNEAKKDLAIRLQELNMPYTKLKAKTLSFEGFGYGNAIFVEIEGATFTNGIGVECFKGIPKPSLGGYVPSIGKDCKWK